jgi:hypothetical protein
MERMILEVIAEWTALQAKMRDYTLGALAWILRETRCDTGLEWRKCLSCKE